MSNPVLVEVLRGDVVESRHRGAVAVVDADGGMVRRIGDIERPVFPRSAVKAIQALPLVESGAADAYGFKDRELALACASHSGEPGHATLALDMLARAGVSGEALECGAHWPGREQAAYQLAREGGAPSALHNNCSGKHAGMLSVAQALGIDTKGYVERDHEVQKRVRRVVETVLGQGLSEDQCGRDGCSIPTWAVPIRSLAHGFARMTTGNGLPEDMANAASRLFDAATRYPFLIAGTNGFDTGAMEAFGGRLMIKIGAEGVFCGALRDKGWGFALKCDDGNMNAATTMIAHILMRLGQLSADENRFLMRFSQFVVRNWRGFEVATIEGVDP